MEPVKPRELQVAARIADALVYAAGVAGVIGGALLFREGEVGFAVIAWVLTFIAGAVLRLAAWAARALAQLLVRTEQMAEEQWRSVIDSDLTATFLTVRSFLPGMIERGRGSIVTMASSAGRLPSQASAAYAAAKAGVVMFSKHVANEVGQHGVRINCLAPSSILTERVERLMPEETQRQVAAMHPLGRMGTPEDVALATLILASDSSSWITGVTLDVAGSRIIV
jgi:3-oxoacyl-[acyl-carrier protein] reductase